MADSAGELIRQRMMMERLTSPAQNTSEWWCNTSINPQAGTTEPPQPYAGLIAYADGINWNPGSTGEGLYIYKSTGWVKLG